MHFPNVRACLRREGFAPCGPFRKCRSMLGLVAASVISIAGLSSTHGQNLVDLGEAANYGVLGNNLNFSNVTVNGDVGVGSGGSINIMSPSSINGDLYMDAGATKSVSGAINGTTYQPYDVDLALADALAAAQYAAGLNPDIVLNSINGPLLINSTGPQTVVNITGSINLSGSDSLLFQGAPDSKFILNVYGGFTLGGSAIIGGQTGSGIDGSDILINVVGTGSKITTKVGNVVQGTLLAPDRAFELHSVNGAVIGGDLELKLMSGATVNQVSFVPEPSSAMLGLIGSLILLRRRRN